MVRFEILERKFAAEISKLTLTFFSLIVIGVDAIRYNA
ncbi:hypothetical protein J2755_001743 [Methanohalophilus levihalophilus]|nr:hypothetical protein [Methanohalophilus levihalophilus]